jgi:carboxylesterase type B
MKLISALVISASLVASSEGTPIRYTAKDCGTSNLQSSDLVPSNPKTGEVFHATNNFNFDRNVSAGFYDIEVYALGNMKLEHAMGPICGANKTFEVRLFTLQVATVTVYGLANCPVAKGPASASYDITLASWLPPKLGNAHFRLKAKDGQGADLVCVDVKLAVNLLQDLEGTPAQAINPPVQQSSVAVGPVVETEDGKLEGVTTKAPRGHMVDQFLGVPFAASPVKENRFRPPQPVEKYSYRQAFDFLDPCHQFDLAKNIFYGSEDCLYLNVYRPAGANAASKLPVFVWIFGGGFDIGSGKETAVDLLSYDGKPVVERHGHIIVTINYRLGALGYLALPEFAAENNGTTGNMGLQDQRQALQWVQRNIHAFGGDPSQVTLAGESAGAMSVGSHIVSPDSKGLFRSAMMDSGDLRSDYYWFPHVNDAYKVGDDYAAKLGCPTGKDRVTCLRNLKEVEITIPATNWVSDWIPELLRYHGFNASIPSDEPHAASPGYPVTLFGPTIDGTSAGLPDAPMKLLENGEFNKVPLFIGTNRDGGSYIGVGTPLAYGAFPVLDNDLDKMARWLFTNETDQRNFMKLYDLPGGFWRKRITFGRVFRDSFFQCSARDIATEISRQGVPVYHYVFDFKYYGFLDKFFHFGVSHAFDVPFVFRTKINFFCELFNADHCNEWWKMADVTSCTWASFIKCQKPKCDDPPPNCGDTYKRMPEWTPFSAPGNRNYLLMSTKPTLENIKAVADVDNVFASDERCDFWKGAHYEMHDPHDFFQNEAEHTYNCFNNKCVPGPGGVPLKTCQSACGHTGNFLQV